METKWPFAILGDVLRHRKEFIRIDDLETYRRPRVQLHTQGIVLRDVILGAEIKTKDQQVCRAGEFLVAEIDAKVGGYGIMPSELDGAIVSSHYFLFQVDADRLDGRFLDFYSRTPAFRDQIAAKGSTNYAAIRPSHVLGYRIPLPPLDEQRRIVARIEALAAKIEEARGLRQTAVTATERLMQDHASAILGLEKWGCVEVGSLLTAPPRNGYAPQQEVELGGVPMLRINAVSSAPDRYVDISAHKRVGVDISTVADFVVQNDDVFIVRYNGDINRVAKAAIYKQKHEDEKIIYPDKLIRLRADLNQVDADFLTCALGIKNVRDQIEGLGKTTAGNIGISGTNVKHLVIPLPPLSEQRRIVAHLDALQAKVDALKRLQAETAAELNALLPSVLARAFGGML